MWHAYHEPKLECSSKPECTFSPGDVVAIYLTTLHVLEPTGISFEPGDDVFFLGHGIVIKELDTEPLAYPEEQDQENCKLYSVLMFGSLHPIEFYCYELKHIDILDIKEQETHLLDFLAADD